MTIETTYTAEQLTAIGASEWQKGEMHRFYFNNLAELYGLKLWHYNTGNISGAELDGEGISNSAAKRILGKLMGKIYFDMATNKFHGRDIDQGAFDKIVANIKGKLVSL